MENKIFIQKEKLDIGATSLGIILCLLFGMYVSLKGNTNMFIGTGLALLFFFGKYYGVCRNNKLIRDGEVVWCKVDRSRCEENQGGIVIRASYFWKNKKQFMQYTGILPMAFWSAKDEHIEKLYTIKYVPVFVDSLDMNRYKMVLCNQWLTQSEVEEKKCMKSVIRVIDSKEIKKEVNPVHETEN